MRKSGNPYESLLLMMGLILKFSFICLFSCTVLVLLAGIFGTGHLALPIYLFVLSVFWRLCATLMGVIAILTMLDGLQ